MNKIEKHLRRFFRTFSAWKKRPKNTLYRWWYQITCPSQPNSSRNELYFFIKIYFHRKIIFFWIIFRMRIMFTLNYLFFTNPAFCTPERCIFFPCTANRAGTKNWTKIELLFWYFCTFSLYENHKMSEKKVNIQWTLGQVPAPLLAVQEQSRI